MSGIDNQQSYVLPKHWLGDSSHEAAVFLRVIRNTPSYLRFERKLDTSSDTQNTPKNKEDQRVNDDRKYGAKKDLFVML